jgi:hypothetical protein
MRIVRATVKTLFIVAFVFLIRISDAQKPQFKVQVDLVSIDVEVLDLQGKPVELSQIGLGRFGANLPQHSRTLSRWYLEGSTIC